MTLTERDTVEMGKDLLTERIESLQNEVRHCIHRDAKTQDVQAPFSALLYCFSTIDLLGSLYTGKFDERKDTENAKIYMREIMFYSDFQIVLLQHIFRHKLVHAAEPKWLYEYNDEFYSWSCYPNYRAKHLELVVLDKEARANNFSISIWSLVEDIVNSVYKNNGYLDKILGKEGRLFNNFSKALDKISST